MPSKEKRRSPRIKILKPSRDGAAAEQLIGSQELTGLVIDISADGLQVMTNGPALEPDVRFTLEFLTDEAEWAIKPPCMVVQVVRSISDNNVFTRSGFQFVREASDASGEALLHTLQANPISMLRCSLRRVP
jgi:hypothetical protein